mmetsp:Transcript_27852/g.52987  ORF Transcript_27852/g.52987 Transcript_27852/m.52987 type:complete len:313 (-) Transcript_27852:280-1218(-)
MHSVETLGSRSSGPCFGTETVAEGNHLDGQVLLFHHLVHVHASQGNLGSASEAQVHALHTVHLGVGHARLEATLLQNARAHQVGRHMRHKPFAHNLVHGPAHEGQLQHGALAREVVELVAAHIGSRLKVQHLHARRDIQMVPHRKRKLRLVVDHVAHGGVLLPAERHLRVRQVGHALALHLQLVLQRCLLHLQLRHLVLQSPSLLNQRLARVGVHLALHLGRGGVARLAHAVGGLLHLHVAVVQTHHLGHVRLGRALVRVLLHQLRVLLDELEVDRRPPRRQFFSRFNCSGGLSQVCGCANRKKSFSLRTDA